ncbi:MAG: glycerate kinase [Elainella sp.]
MPSDSIPAFDSPSHNQPSTGPADQALEQCLRDLVTEPMTETAVSDQSQRDKSHQFLATQLLSQTWQVQAFGLTPDRAAARVEQRLQRLRALHPILSQFCQTQLGWSSYSLVHCWQLWLPLAEQLLIWQDDLQRPLIQGILGGQGTGKTTLTRLLATILSQLGRSVAYLSIDDLYKTYAERQQLQRLDPRFSWRGPPGTHDVELGLNLLQQLRQSQFPVAIPRFDKSLHGGAGDRTQAERIERADILLFEGWFVGVRPIDPARFATAPSPIVTAADREFAQTVNRQLQAYLPLWDLLDRWLLLYPTNYRFSQQWRWQAEQQMQAAGRTGMSAAAVNEFVEYFWRALHPELFVKPLLGSEAVDLVVELGESHQIGAIYCPRAEASAGSRARSSC